MITNFDNIETILIPKRKVMFEKCFFNIAVEQFIFNEMQSCETRKLGSHCYFIKNDIILFEFELGTADDMNKISLWILRSKQLEKLFGEYLIYKDNEIETCIYEAFKHNVNFAFCCLCGKINLNGTANFNI